LAIDHFITTSDGSIEAEISQTDLQLLKKTSYKYTLLIPDVTKRLDSFNRIYYNSIRTSGEGQRVAIQQPGSTINSIITTPINFEVKPTFAGYYTFAEMEAAIDLLVAQYPTIASKESIGKTYGNRDLWVVKISDNVSVDESEPEAFFMGLQHAREAITGASMIFFMQYLCEQYSTNTKIKDLVDNREIFIMPCFNPDGWEYNFTSTSGNGGGSWRKNRSPNSDGTFGKDLNRNWGVDWGNCSSPILGDPNSCGTSATSADTYYGPSAFSELETQALRAFTKTRSFVTAFDQHAFGPYYL
jgi:murein tripeptide amidase MpaA